MTQLTVNDLQAALGLMCEAPIKVAQAKAAAALVTKFEAVIQEANDFHSVADYAAARRLVMDEKSQEPTDAPQT